MTDKIGKRLPRATTLEEILAMLAAPTAPLKLESGDHRPIRLPRAAPLIVVSDSSAEVGALRH